MIQGWDQDDVSQMYEELYCCFSPAAKSNYGVDSGDVHLFIFCSVCTCNTSKSLCEPSESRTDDYHGLMGFMQIMCDIEGVCQMQNNWVTAVLATTIIIHENWYQTWYVTAISNMYFTVLD